MTAVPHDLVVTAAGFALLAVVTPFYEVLGHVETAVHEGGHALVGAVFGHEVGRIRLEKDRSGSTPVSGNWLALTLSLMAGYLAPSALGLVFASLLHTGTSVETLMLLGMVLAGALLLLVENWFGRIVLLSGLGALAYLLLRGSPQAKAYSAYGLTWFLLFGGLRGVYELLTVWRVGGHSDARMLFRRTFVPGIVWVLAFGVFAVWALLTAWRLLVP